MDYSIQSSISGNSLPCHAPKIYNQLIADHVWIYWPSQRGSKCSCLLNESWQQQQRLRPGLLLVETQWPDWTWGISCTSSLNPDTNQRPWDPYLGHRCPKCARAHSERGNEQLFLPFVFHTFYWLQLFTRRTTFPPLSASTSLSQTCTHTHSSTHFPGRCESVYSFGRGQLHTWWQPRMVVLAQVRVCGERRAGKGRDGWMGPQACPSGSAQPAHSSSFSAGASTGMSPHVRNHCLKGGLLVWLKRPFRRINRDESWTCCVQFPKVMCCRTGYLPVPINLPVL